MRKLRMNKRGFTLAELCVVIALIAIATLLMTSFMAVFQTRTAQNTARHDFLDEVALVRDEMQKWVSNRDCGNAIYVSTNMLSSNSGTDLVVFSSDSSNIVFNYSSDDVSDIVLSLKAISNIEFTVYTKLEDQAGGGAPILASNSQKILKCTFIGKDVFGQEFSQTMMFSLMSENAVFVQDIPTDNPGESNDTEVSADSDKS